METRKAKSMSGKVKIMIKIKKASIRTYSNLQTNPSCFRNGPIPITNNGYGIQLVKKIQVRVSCF